MTTKTQNEAVENFNTGPDENNTKSVKLSKQVRKEVLTQNW